MKELKYEQMKEVVRLQTSASRQFKTSCTAKLNVDQSLNRLKLNDVNGFDTGLKVTSDVKDSDKLQRQVQ